MKGSKLTLITITAALAVSVAAVFARAQQKTTKRPDAPAVAAPASTPAAKTARAADDSRYQYEFTNPQFFVHRIRLSHDSAGRGSVTFERKTSDEVITEPLELSADALARIRAHWDALAFLDSNASYQAEKQFPHLGTMRLSMARGGRDRSAEFNWTDNPNAKGLADEYRRAADQVMTVFELNVARENQPLETPKLVEALARLVERGAISDASQLLPLLRDLRTDERVPLIARNRAEKLLQRIEKDAKKSEKKEADKNAVKETP